MPKEDPVSRCLAQCSKNSKVQMQGCEALAEFSVGRWVGSLNFGKSWRSKNVRRGKDATWHQTLCHNPLSYWRLVGNEGV